MEYMFTPERELPPGVGYAPFGAAHLLTLGVLAAVSALVIRLACGLKEGPRIRLLRGMAALMVVLELWKDGMLLALGVSLVGYLPLHLCSLAMLICVVFAWRPGSDWAGQLVWNVCFSGGLAALLFPDWTHMPLWHFQSLHSFLYHAMLVQFSLIAVITGMARPRVSRVWKSMAFLLIAAAAVYGVNLELGTNYMFLMRPVPGTPLTLCARLPGRAGYLAGYGLLTLGVLILMDLPFSLAACWKQLHRKDGRM